MKLTGELLATGGTTTGLKVPDEFVTELGGGGRPKVVATVNGYRWRTSIAKMGGDYWLGISSANRTAAGVQAQTTTPRRFDRISRSEVVRLSQ